MEESIHIIRVKFIPGIVNGLFIVLLRFGTKIKLFDNVLSFRVDDLPPM